MRFLLLITASAAILAACSGSQNGKGLATEVCDCYKKANALPADDPNRSKEQDACIKKQGEAWAKVKDNQDEADKFNDEISKCSRAQIKESINP